MVDFDVRATMRKCMVYWIWFLQKHRFTMFALALVLPQLSLQVGKVTPNNVLFDLAVFWIFFRKEPSSYFAQNFFSYAE